MGLLSSMYDLLTYDSLLDIVVFALISCHLLISCVGLPGIVS